MNALRMVGKVPDHTCQWHIPSAPRKGKCPPSPGFELQATRFLVKCQVNMTSKHALLEVPLQVY